MNKFVVMGGAGAMGRFIVRDLVHFGVRAEGPNPMQVVIADREFEAAQRFAAEFAHPSVTAAPADVRDHEGTTRLLTGATAVLNAVDYPHNLRVMEAALGARCHYTDLGGLFHTTNEQLKLHDRFREADLLALLGMGVAPGITNILARRGADQLDQVTEIHIRSAFVDRTRYRWKPPLWTSFSLPTQLHELTQEPALFTGGKMTFVDPRSGRGSHHFPEPLGMVQGMIYALHSEIATLPFNFGADVQETSFKLALEPEFLERAEFLVNLGFASNKPIDIGGGVMVSPIRVLDQLFRAQGQPVLEDGATVDESEVVRAIVKGWKDGQQVTVVSDFLSEGIPELGLGVDADTGTPSAIWAQLLGAGLLDARGVLPPEQVIRGDLSDRFVAELTKRGMRVESHTHPGWGFET